MKRMSTRRPKKADLAAQRALIRTLVEQTGWVGESTAPAPEAAPAPIISIRLVEADGSPVPLAPVIRFPQPPSPAPAPPRRAD